MGRLLRAGDVVALVGELGSGKTTLTQGIAQGLGIDASTVKSPSFVLMKEYRTGRAPLYHIDLYRLEGFTDIQRMGYEDYLGGDGVAVVEWAERLQTILPGEHLRVDLEHVNPSTRPEGLAQDAGATRRLIFRAVGERYATLVQMLTTETAAR